MSLRKQFQFTLTLTGIGETRESAWIDSMEAFTMDAGEWNEVDVIGLECDDCGTVVEHMPDVNVFLEREENGENIDFYCDDCK